MDPVKILDSSALMAYFEDEPGGSTVKSLFLDAAPDEPLLMSVVNWGEIYYLARRISPGKANEITAYLDGLPIAIVDADREQTRLAAEMKADGGISYADCFAAALTKMKQGVLATKDKEFNRLKGQIKILWL